MTIVKHRPARFGEAQAFIRSAAGTADVKTCILWPFGSRNHDGRPKVRRPSRPDSPSVSAAKVVWELHHGADFPEGLEARHLCGNGHLGCLNPHHVIPGTAKQNAADREDHGRTARGLRHGRTRLTDAQVQEIRSRLGHGETGRDLAKEYGVTYSYIYKLGRAEYRNDTPGNR